MIRAFGACVDCDHRGSEENPLTCDHVVPKSAGGTDEWSNLTVRCRSCNSAKGTKRT
ncbi:HNH endonuclease signature motif containing protein [Streptosporangium sp. NPDC048865]|uniref:HNH endonuclease n=1 Tax=Streptosporangium sp. NPDC048865 TaxID=3155766 RepID=UPI003438E856